MHLTLENAEALLPGGLQPTSVSIENGLIVMGKGRSVDLTGCRIFPGIVDLHGDGFERHLAPRRGAMMDMSEGLFAVDAELAANGITTAVLAQFWSYEGGMRRPEFAQKLVNALLQVGDDLLTDMPLQLRLETHLIDEYPDAEALIDRAGIKYVVFNDHLPHDALEKGKRPPRLTGQALKSRRSPEAHWALLQELHNRGPEVPKALAALAARLRDKGVQLGSHDDATPEERSAFREMGARIAEFPETREAAEAAQSAGDPIVLGAPNVMRGGSHAGNVAAAELIKDGLCDAIVSDYHYPSVRRAAVQLADTLGLEAAWRLVSERPAEILGLTDRGRIEPGLRADLVVLDPKGRVGATFSAGQLAFARGAIAARIMGTG
ncbi:alpha-D-ribose 1-methylphosphonate 5-triphosphate diphosphatase [Actibacterium pelagium]|uniref:Alpha-D-ribose 1-methylphosphonate 5-triphosphate diphosphatase n=1 Tax=Actibacterium pelagium TaxID=2029103 RepID=A0A917AHB7_9RHOB|nr:alpha-D-ribose 1-methylphosphonate 5-triphosphate diphosphatase [Actibacterium pelagium]GGE51600.1 alpha-D-ribose 1-methylphosphonate 5-triphosphate diphosphatase [Actibacterium pelagium]